jgi:hypothetical protein
MQDVALRLHHALRPPRRTRRVEHEAEPAAADSNSGRRVRRGVDAVGVEHLRAVLGNLQRQCVMSRCGQQDVSGDVDHDAGQTRSWMARVERHVVLARLQHAEQQHDRRRSGLRQHDDRLLAIAARGEQRLRDPVGREIELAIRQLAMEVFDGEPIGERRDLPLEAGGYRALDVVLRELAVLVHHTSLCERVASGVVDRVWYCETWNRQGKPCAGMRADAPGSSWLPAVTLTPGAEGIAGS